MKNYIIKRILICTGLLFLYWACLFNYKQITEATLQVLGSVYIGFLIYDIAARLIPKTEENV